MAEEQNTSIVKAPRLSLASAIAEEYGIEMQDLIASMKQIVFPPKDRKGDPPTNAQVIAYLSVCQQFGLNPFLRHVWPFPQRDGGFIPVASIDGWIHVKNGHPNFAGEEYKEIYDDKGNLIAGEMTISFKDGRLPYTHREWFTENRRDTEPWKMVHRMMENRTSVQTIRRAFGIGIPDQDDMEMSERNITAESTVMERSTNERTEQLKEKIGAKKKAQEKAPEPPIDPAIHTHNLTAEDTNANTVVVPPIEEPPFDLLPPEVAEENGSRIISDKERGELLDVLKSRQTPENKEQLMKDVRKKLFDYGYTNTKEIKTKDLKGLMEWAKALNI